MISGDMEVEGKDQMQYAELCRALSRLLDIDLGISAAKLAGITCVQTYTPVASFSVCIYVYRSLSAFAIGESVNVGIFSRIFPFLYLFLNSICM